MEVQKMKQYYVSNTYPVIRKLYQELKEGKEIPFQLKSIDYKEFSLDLNDRVRIETEKIYFNNINKIVDISSRFNLEKESLKIQEILYTKFRLIFLKSKTSIIFLNYHRVKLGGCSLVPSFIKERSDFIRKLEIKNEYYACINTFEAFLSYCDIKNLPINKKTNNEFYGDIETDFYSTFITYPTNKEGILNYFDINYHYYKIGSLIIIDKYLKCNDMYVTEKKDYHIECSENIIKEKLTSNKRYKSNIEGINKEELTLKKVQKQKRLKNLIDKYLRLGFNTKEINKAISNGYFSYKGKVEFIQSNEEWKQEWDRLLENDEGGFAHLAMSVDKDYREEWLVEKEQSKYELYLKLEEIFEHGECFYHDEKNKQIFSELWEHIENTIDSVVTFIP